MLNQKKNILISIPSYYDSLLFLPYIHAVLKTHCEKSPEISENYTWLEPICLNDTAEALLAPYEERIDVLGLSCYTWNWFLQLEIAKLVKKRNPDCLIVMGGPHPDWNDPDFFKTFPFVDIVVKNEGEEIFKNILIEKLKVDKDYKKIKNLILPTESKETLHTPLGEKIQTWSEESVWQTDDMRRLALKYQKWTRLAAIWETNRGCPYQCSFCDWGSATYSKTRLFPVERLEKDLQAFSEYKISKIVVADANFGMFPRDVEIAQRVVHYKKISGYPHLLYWASAKNKAEPILEIAKIFYKSGLDDSVVIGLQSMNEDTVIEMGRGAHSIKTFVKLSEMVDNENIPKIAQIIMGSPKESAQEFVDSLHKTLDLNFHRSLFIRNYAVLPNAPIARPEQLKKYGIVTIDRPANKVWSHKSTIWKWDLGEEKIVVSHDKMNLDDWIYASMYKTHLMCLHHLGITRFISRLYRNLFKVSYADFYSYLYKRAREDAGHVGQCYQSVENDFKKYLTEPKSYHAAVGIDEDWFIDHESALFCRLILKQDELFSFLYNALKDFSKARGISDDIFSEIFNYQKNILISPDYNPESGRSFTCEYDFFEYFKNLKDRDDENIPLEKKKVYYRITEAGRQLKDQYCHFNWIENGSPNLKRYQQSVIIGTYQRYILAPVFEEVSTLKQLQ